jgi:pimeloyl-ACP methyl ester carboxylesterase
MLTLVLLPGMDGTGRLFQSFVAALGREIEVKVVAYPPGEPLGYSELEPIARAALPMEGPYIVLGESFSGPLAISLAASGSPQLKGLVLCCTFVRNPHPFSSRLRSLVTVLPVVLPPVSLLARLLLGRFSTPALREALEQALAPVSRSTLRARMLAVLSVDVTAELSAVKVPVLYLRASDDLVVPSSAAALVSKLNPRTQVVELEAPHFLLQAAPAVAAQAVEAFVRSCQEVC